MSLFTDARHGAGSFFVVSLDTALGPSFVVSLDTALAILPVAPLPTTE